jgi:hypothetical protein
VESFKRQLVEAAGEMASVQQELVADLEAKIEELNEAIAMYMELVSEQQQQHHLQPASNGSGTGSGTGGSGAAAGTCS